MERLKSAIIGTGGIARAHVRAVQEVRDRAARDAHTGGPLAGLEIDLVAAMDVDAARAEKFAEDHGIPESYADATKLLRETRPDVVQICTPPGPHTELIVQSLEAGAWVLCEKPLCGGLAELDRIEEAERRSGAYCSSVVQQRFGSAARHVRGLIESGELGRPTIAICQTTWYRDDAYYAVPWHARWADAFGGPVMTLGIHTMDLFLWLMGDFAEVSALADRLDPNKEVEDVSVASVRLESGALASVVNSVLSPRQETYLRLDFQRATVEARYLYRNTGADWRISLPDHPSFKPTAEQLATQERWRAIPTGDDEIVASQGTQLAALLEARARGERPPASGPGIRRTIEFISCLYKAAATGRSVKRGSLAKDDPFYQRTHGTLPQLLG